MKKSLCIEKIFLEVDFYDRFQCVADAGFAYVEFWNWHDKDIPRIASLCASLGLTVASISGDFRYTPFVLEERERYLEYLAQSIDIAAGLGCKNIVVHSNGMDKGVVFNDGRGISMVKKVASMARTFTEGAALAEKAGITLVLEAVNNISVPDYFITRTRDSGDLARAIDSPHFKILYDIWHMQQMEGNLVRTITEYRDVIGYVHIGDTPERHEPGTGEVNFDCIKKTFLDIGYDGIWGFELVPSVPSPESARLLQAF